MTDDTARPRPPVEYNTSVQEVPYGGPTIVQIGGRKSSQLSLKVFVRAEDFASFSAQVGQSGSLVLLGNTYSAVLMSASEMKDYNIEGLIMMSATFVVR